MKKNGLLISGILMVLCSLGIFLYMQIQQNRADEQTQVYLQQMQKSMPEVKDAFIDERNNKDMPVLEVAGNDFVGILEVPLYEVSFPIGSRWQEGELIDYPCRFWGSVYDGSMIIGGSERKGQMAFMKDISIGDEVFVTDMTGARYLYTVSWIEKTKDVSIEYLENDGLTIFARNPYGFDYTVVRCR